MPDTEPTYTGCAFQSEVLSKQLLAYLIDEQGFDLDSLQWDDSKITDISDLMNNWKKEVDPVTTEELTTRQIGGSGVFDAIMDSIHNHIQREYDAGRITGAEYAKTYTQLTEAGLSQAVRFTLEKNQAYWNSVLAQAQAITAGINAQIAVLTAKVQFARIKAEALSVAANFALTTMKLSTEDAQHALVCKQKALVEAQTITEIEQAALVHEQVNTQTEQTALTHEQVNTQTQQTVLTNRQVILTEKQTISEIERAALTHEQINTQIEQTAHTHEQVALTHEQINTQVQQTRLVHEQGSLTNEQVNTQVQQTAVTNKQIAHTESQTTLLDKQAITETERAALTHEQTATQVEQTAVTHEQIDFTVAQAEYLRAQKDTEEQKKDLTESQVKLTDAQTITEQQKAIVTQQQAEATRQQARLYEYQAIANDPNHVAGVGTNVDFLLKDAQKRLYYQQIHSYRRNDERKVAEIFSSTFTALKAINELLENPSCFNHSEITTVINNLARNVGLNGSNPGLDPDIPAAVTP